MPILFNRLTNNKNNSHICTDIYDSLNNRMMDLILLTPILQMRTWGSEKLRGMIPTWLKTPRSKLPFDHSASEVIECGDIPGIRRVESGAYASAGPALAEAATSPAHQGDEGSRNEYLGEERKMWRRDWVIYISSCHLWLLKYSSWAPHMDLIILSFPGLALNVRTPFWMISLI